MFEWQDTGEVEKLGLDFKRQIFLGGLFKQHCYIADMRKKNQVRRKIILYFEANLYFFNF